MDELGGGRTPIVGPQAGGRIRWTYLTGSGHPVEHQAGVKAAYWAIFDPTGELPIAMSRARAGDFSATFGRRLPSAVACLNDDLASLFSHLRFPVEHHKRTRHSNFIERTFGEIRRRVTVIGRLPEERSCLGLVWAVLDRASRGWRGVTMTPATVRQLQELRRQLLHLETGPEAAGSVTDTVTAVAYHHRQNLRPPPVFHRGWDATMRFILRFTGR